MEQLDFFFISKFHDHFDYFNCKFVKDESNWRLISVRSREMIFLDGYLGLLDLVRVAVGRWRAGGQTLHQSPMTGVSTRQFCLTNHCLFVAAVGLLFFFLNFSYLIFFFFLFLKELREFSS